MARQSTAAATPWYRDLTPYHWFVFVVASLAWLFDCLDQQLFILARNKAMESLLPASMDAKLYGGYATSIFVAGWALGGLIFGSLGDRFGRAKMLTLTVLIARGRRMALAVVVVLVGAAFALGVASPGIRGRALSAVSVAENVDRTSMWERTRALVAEYPLQGVGYGRYEAATRELFGPPPRGQPEHRGPHNIYLQATAEIGLLGAGALLILFAAALAAGFRAASGAHAGSQRRIIGAVAVGTVTAVAISGLFHDVLDIGQIAFELWIVVGLAESQISDGPERLSERQEDDARVDGQ